MPLQDSRDTLRTPWKYIRTSRHAAWPRPRSDCRAELAGSACLSWCGSRAPGSKRMGSETACPGCSGRGRSPRTLLAGVRPGWSCRDPGLLPGSRCIPEATRRGLQRVARRLS